MTRAFILGVSYYLPSNNLNNEQISMEHPEWSIDKIANKTGIDNRCIAEDDEFVSDMATRAAENLFKEYKIDRNSIDYILLCTQNPDYTLPTTACIVQNRLGLSKSIGAIDFNLGCSGYIYGLGLAKGLLLSGQAKNILLITADIYSKIINPHDKSNKTLFGDAASATLISSCPAIEGSSYEILDFEYGTDGSGYDNLIVKNSGARKLETNNKTVFDEEGKYLYNDNYLFMDGLKIFNFTSFNVPPIITKVLDKNNLTDNDISYYVFHQANTFMLDFIRKRCGIAKSKFFVSMSDIGNTVSSSIPIALKRLLINYEIKNSVLLCGFGVGLSIGGTILRKYENR